MYGVLLVETAAGQPGVLQAFSGLLNGKPVVAGWVPPMPGRDRVALAEARTLANLAAIKQELIALQHCPERQQYAMLAQTFEADLNELTRCHAQCKHDRQQQRQRFLQTLTGAALTAALEQLDHQSRQDGIARRQLKRQRDASLQPLKQTIDEIDTRIRGLKQQRKALSQQLQAQMHATYSLTNFAGESRSLQQLLHTIPTGTGDCCAPKLLHYAATHHLKPLAMAEFWWGPPSIAGEKVSGTFYGACVDRCQPLMGFLLFGLSQNHSISQTNATEPLSILYQDLWLIAVNKPAGLLSVPGRYLDRQDCVIHRLQHQLADGKLLRAVHRLDQDTSGILLIARDLQTYRQLSQQFEQRQVCKLYEAVLAGPVLSDQGTIDLPLWGDPADCPHQKVDWQRGKPAITQFRVMQRSPNSTRVLFTPTTGRTHQLRVHAADPAGLGVAILGDRLYGDRAAASRLHLHARELEFTHPQTQARLHLHTETPF
jgi:tRNA pseudouridine32 synthase/23S rRNA pseudouridine746 synthase